MDPTTMKKLAGMRMAIAELLRRNKRDRKYLKQMGALLEAHDEKPTIDPAKPPVFIMTPSMMMNGEMLVGSPGLADNAETYESRWVYYDAIGCVQLDLFQLMPGSPRRIWVLQEAAMNAIARFNESCDKKEEHITFMKTGIRYQTTATGPGGQVIATSPSIYPEVPDHGPDL